MLTLARLIERMTKVHTKQSPSCDEVRALASQIISIASSEPHKLEKELNETLEDVARHINRVDIAVTALAWLGSGTRSVEQALSTLVDDAEREIVVCAYTITPSALPLLLKIEEAADQGVMVTVAVNDFNRQAQEIQLRLRNASRTNPELWRLRDFVPSTGGAQLHAKLMVVDRSAALVGSANLSFHGMTLNHELAVLLQGPIAESIAARADLLLNKTRPVSVA
jgi:phosphatidylserine/phosphatidylglycerophosphate/cardiolipin synthase-like enzyme